MPLRCLSAEKDELAFEHDEVSWAKLRELNLREKCLRFSCCDSSVVLKTSPLGTRYFAHKARGGCDSGPETQEHIWAKTVICKALKAAGWISRPEERFQDQHGVCIVDVLGARTESSASRIAFEVQWSAQTPDVTLARTERYKNHDLRSLWFFRQAKVPSCREIPAVRIAANGETFDVLLPKERLLPRHHLRDWEDYLGRDVLADPENWRNCGSLETFVMGVLDGRFRFGLAPEFEARISIVGFSEDHCNRCGAQTMPITGVLLDFGPLNPDYAPLFVSTEELGNANTSFARKIVVWINKNLSQRTGYKLTHRASRTRNETYLANTCGRCGAFYGNFFLATHVDDPTEFAELRIMTTPPDLRELNLGPDRWCYIDPGNPVRLSPMGQVEGSARDSLKLPV